MDDYFALAGYNSVAQGIMGRAKLEGSARLWLETSLSDTGQVGDNYGMG